MGFPPRCCFCRRAIWWPLGIEGLPEFDGVAYRAPLLRGRARSSEIGLVYYTDRRD